MSYIYRNRKGKKVYGWSCQIQIGDVGGRYPLGVNTKVEARKLQQQIIGSSIIKEGFLIL